MQNLNHEAMFFGKRPNIARLDQLKYPFFQELTEKQRGFFWRPQEVEVNRDAKDFKSLMDNEKHIFTSNLKRQILLDSVQGRCPVEIFGPHTSLPEMEVWMRTWSMFEDIHSFSYQYIIDNVYPNASMVYDGILDIPEILSCNNDINYYYENFRVGSRTDDGPRRLWLALNAVNVLEGIRFYVSFACSWAFAETKRMEGNAKIIKFIARDENLHLAGTQQMLRLLPKESDVWARIEEEERPNCIAIFESAVKQERAWAKYLFKDGSIIGLNEELLCDYVEWIAHKRMLAIGLPSPFKGGSNPLPWTEKWIRGQDVQVAPQEVQISSYTIGGIRNDVEESTFKNFDL